jgi:hypothetical protein
VAPLKLNCKNPSLGQGSYCSVELFSKVLLTQGGAQHEGNQPVDFIGKGLQKGKQRLETGAGKGSGWPSRGAKPSEKAEHVGKQAPTQNSTDLLKQIPISNISRLLINIQICADRFSSHAQSYRGPLLALAPWLNHLLITTNRRAPTSGLPLGPLRSLPTLSWQNPLIRFALLFTWID